MQKTLSLPRQKYAYYLELQICNTAKVQKANLEARLVLRVRYYLFTLYLSSVFMTVCDN